MMSPVGPSWPTARGKHQRTSPGCAVNRRTEKSTCTWLLITSVQFKKVTACFNHTCVCRQGVSPPSPL